MRKLFTILAFLPFAAHSQITFNALAAAGSQSTNASAFGITGATLQAGKLYLFIAQTTGTTNPGTITATTTTWTSVASIGNSTNRIQIFRCSPGSLVTGENISLGTFGGGSTGYSLAVYEVSGVVTTGTNGADAIVQAVTAGPTTGTDPTITMAALTGNRNGVMAFFSNDANPFGGTEESGWTEIFDGGYSTPTAGFYEMRRLLTVDNTPTVTASSSTWIGIAIELNASGRRRGAIL